MNILQSIQKAENEADETIKKAEKEAFTIISHAHEKEEIEISTLKKALKENELQKINEQKISLAKLYKEIISDGRKEIEKKEGNRKKAVQFILNNI